MLLEWSGSAMTPLSNGLHLPYTHLSKLFLDPPSFLAQLQPQQYRGAVHITAMSHVFVFVFVFVFVESAIH